MHISNLTKLLLIQLHGKPCDIVEIDRITYKEQLNFAAQWSLVVLSEVEWTEDQVKEAQAVRFGHHTERYMGYYKYWNYGVSEVIAELERDTNSRRAIIYFGHKEEIPSCLISLQFLIRHNALDVIANFRSWELETFASYDLCLIFNLSNLLCTIIGHLDLGKLYVNAGSAHIKVK